jgi:hypothetical protein
MGAPVAHQLGLSRAVPHGSARFLHQIKAADFSELTRWSLSALATPRRLVVASPLLQVPEASCGCSKASPVSKISRWQR